MNIETSLFGRDICKRAVGNFFKITSLKNPVLKPVTTVVHNCDSIELSIRDNTETSGKADPFKWGTLEAPP